MDLLDELREFSTKKRKTYEKEDHLNDEAEADCVLLENSSLIERIRKRLDGAPEDLADAKKKKQLFSPFHSEDLYNGQELEDDFVKEPTQSVKQKNLENQFGSQTQILITQATQVCATQKDVQGLYKPENITQIVTNSEETQADSKTYGESNSTITKLSTQKKQHAHNSNRFESTASTAGSDVRLKQPEKFHSLENKNISTAGHEISNEKLPQLSCSSHNNTAKKYTTDKLIDAFDDSDSSMSNTEVVNENKSDTFRSVVDDMAPQTEGVTPNVANSKILSDKSEQYVELGNSSDSEEEFKSVSSKAAVLQIKARKVKRNASKKRKTSNIEAGSLKELFVNLRNKNRNQILALRQEISQRKGISIEAIEHEKVQVEKLLEQELERNRRIKLKEQRERALVKESMNTVNEQIESDIPDSDSVIESELLFDSDDQESITKDEDIDTEQQLTDIPMNNIQDKNAASLVETNQKFAAANLFTISERKVEINLGHYGDNLHNSPNELNDSSSESEQSGLKGHSTSLHAQRKAARPILTATSSDSSTSSSSEEDESMDELEKASIIQENRERLKKSLLTEKKQKERLKLTGLHKVLEMEAEESEDEWHGVGGADGELSDAYDSELENMIDDLSKNKVDLASIRESLAKENRELDERMINKILHDVKTGGFRKRGRGALDIEFSDDEDESLRQFRVRRKELMKQKMLESVQEISSNDRAKAFFESMVEEADESGAVSSKNILVTENEGSKKTVISEEFVHSSLSFLNSKDDQINEFELSRLSADENEDLTMLKQRSSIKVLISPKKDNFFDVDSSINPSLEGRLPSIMRSFSSSPSVNDKFKTGIKTVTTSKSYRTASGSKSAITFLQRRKLRAPKASAPARNKERKPTSSLFDSNSDSFS